MPGYGRAPDEVRVRRAAPARGDWRAPDGVGWQYGEVPKPPTGLLKASRDAWATWMGAWFAAFWTPADLPGLRQVIRLYDEVERGRFQRAGELRLQMDGYGITPKGQQDRRWKPAIGGETSCAGVVARGAAVQARERFKVTDGAYAHLRVVDPVERPSPHAPATRELPP